MNHKTWRDRILQQEDLNFQLTNRVPRIALTRFMDRFSQIRQPLVRDLCLRTWKLLGDLDRSEARKSSFDSLHDCVIRELKPGARHAAAHRQHASGNRLRMGQALMRLPAD